MKTVAVLLLVGVFLFGLTGCAQGAEKEQTPKISPTEVVETTTTIPEFSYEAVRSQFGETTPGVKTDGFRNVTQCPITGEKDAVERAKAECTVKYDLVRVRYDSTADMWEISFLSNHPGGGQDVYLNSKGLTQLIVYGE